MVKVISLSEEAYGRLKSIKGNRSFSEIVIEIAPKKKNIMELAGAFEKNSEEWERIEKELYLERKKAKMRYF
jgi:predicted CopG family antitoxin